MYPMKFKPNVSAIQVSLSWLPKMAIVTSHATRCKKSLEGKLKWEERVVVTDYSGNISLFQTLRKHVTCEHIPRPHAGPWRKPYKCIPSAVFTSLWICLCCGEGLTWVCFLDTEKSFQNSKKRICYENYLSCLDTFVWIKNITFTQRLFARCRPWEEHGGGNREGTLLGQRTGEAELSRWDPLSSDPPKFQPCFGSPTLSKILR